MANIGRIERTPAGQLVGRVGTLSFAVAFWLSQNTEPKRSEKTPTHIIWAKDPMGEPCEIGCIREKTAKKTGELYKQIQFTDGSIPEKYHWLAVFGNEQDGFRIVYDPTLPPAAAEEKPAH